jgi:hypothetical protein
VWHVGACFIGFPIGLLVILSASTLIFFGMAQAAELLGRKNIQRIRH